MTKILIVITTGFVPWGGLATVAMNYYRAMDKTGLHIDFASCNVALQPLADEINKSNSQYIQLPSRKKKIFSYMKALYQLLKREEYDVIHIHGNSATMTFELLPAFMAGIRKRIVHVHSCGNQHTLLHTFLYPIFNKLITDRISVSDASGQYLYKKNKFIVLNNAIDTSHYRFREELRKQCRRKYSIDEDDYVIGTVGKLNHGKNHVFLINVFAEIIKFKTKAKLLIVGGGQLKDNLMEQTRALNIEESCIFVGMQSDTVPFLAAMDVFVFPSLAEGLGMAVIEAQASGLPCIVSDTVPSETKVSDNIKYISLQLPVEHWAKETVRTDIQNRSIKSKAACESIASCGYGIEQEANRLRKIYLEA